MPDKFPPTSDHKLEPAQGEPAAPLRTAELGAAQLAAVEMAQLRQEVAGLRASEARYRSLVEAGSAIMWDSTASGRYRYMTARAVPILDEQGAVREWVGVHVDIDERKRVEQRLRLLDTMSQATRNAVDPQTVMEVTTRLLGQHMGVSRCPYADVEADNDRFTIRHDWTAEGAVSTVGVYSLDLFGKRAASDMREGRTLRIGDVDRELSDSEGAAMFNAIACKAIICCPLVKEGRLVAMMAVHQDRPRDWTGHDVALVEEAVERCWAHIERVRANEALRDADRRKTEFLAILAHELRNPLAPIRNGLQVMRLSQDKPATTAKVRDMMERQVTQWSTWSTICSTLPASRAATWH